MSTISSVIDHYEELSYCVYTYIIYLINLFLFSFSNLVTLARVQHNKLCFGNTEVVV